MALLGLALVASGCGVDGGEDISEAPSATPTATTLLAEDFEGTTTAFETGTNGNAEVSVENGQLKLYSEDDEAESLAPLTAPADSLTFDVDVTVGMARESLDAGTEDWFGVACASGEDAYFMLADVFGSFYLFARKNGDYEQLGDNYKNNFEAATGDEFHLSAACTHDESGTVGLSLFIDGEEVLTGADTDAPLATFDGVGVFGQQDESDGNTAYSTFLFDNVDVEPLEP